MHWKRGLASLAALALLTILAPVHGQQDPAPTGNDDEPPQTSTASGSDQADDAATDDGESDESKKPPPPPPKGSPYKTLRFDEDWSFLEDPDAKAGIWFPEIKWMELGRGWNLSLGGQFRFRYMNASNLPGFGAKPKHNSFYLTRTMVHADLRHESGFRFYVGLLDSRIHSSSRSATPIDQNNLDYLDAFAEYTYEGTGTTLRGGRFQMAEGAQRLISPLDWANTRRTFQGGMVRQKWDGGKVDVFVTHPVTVDARNPDKPLNGTYFSGAYSTFDLESIGDHVDVFGLAQNQTKNKTMGSTRTGKADTYTLGARYWGKASNVDYELWGAQQFGQRAGDSTDAYAVTLNTGITLPDVATSPRFGVSLDYASGDRNPKDRDNQTFNQLYPLGHKYFGYLDLVGRQNIIDIQPNITMSLTERLKFHGEFHYFRLASDKDALYNAGGRPILQDTTGSSGDNVGTEIDLKLNWNPEWLSYNGGFEFGWSQLDPGRFIDSQTPGDKPTLFWAQVVLYF